MDSGKQCQNLQTVIEKVGPLSIIITTSDPLCMYGLYTDYILDSLAFKKVVKSARYGIIVKVVPGNRSSQMRICEGRKVRTPFPACPEK